MLGMACVALFLYALFERHEIDPSFLLFMIGGFLASHVFLKRAREGKKRGRKGAYLKDQKDSL